MLRRLLLEQLDPALLLLQVLRGLFGSQVETVLDAAQALLDHRGQLVRPLRDRDRGQERGRDQPDAPARAPSRATVLQHSNSSTMVPHLRNGRTADKFPAAPAII